MTTRPLLLNRRRRAGQAVIEFALSGMLFLILLLTIMDMAYAVFSYTTICAAARAAVRYAIVHGPSSPSPATDAQIQQVALNAAPGVALVLSEVTVTWPTDPNLSTKKDAQVKIVHLYKLQALVAPVSLNLSSTSRMLVSQ